MCFRKALVIEQEELKKTKGVVGEEGRDPGEDCIQWKESEDGVNEQLHKM